MARRKPPLENIESRKKKLQKKFWQERSCEVIRVTKKTPDRKFFLRLRSRCPLHARNYATHTVFIRYLSVISASGPSSATVLLTYCGLTATYTGSGGSGVISKWVISKCSGRQGCVFKRMVEGWRCRVWTFRCGMRGGLAEGI